MSQSRYQFGLTFKQRTALDDFQPVLLQWREGLFLSYVDRYTGRVMDDDVLQQLATIESFAKAFDIELPELTLED